MHTNPQTHNPLPPEDERQARRRLGEVPCIGPKRASAARLTRLQGLTNRVYAVALEGKRYCLRIPGPGTEAIIDRRNEEANARQAAAAGVAPPVLYFSDDGVMLTPLLDAVVLAPMEVLRRTGSLERVAEAFYRLHQTAAPFARNFDPFAAMDRYVAMIEQPDGPPRAVAELMGAAREIAHTLAASPIVLRPCHCDPTGRNLLDTGTRVHLIDWEYSGQNDPAWDLAYFSLESGLDPLAEAKLLRAYHGRVPRARDASRVEVMKPVCLLLAGLWSLAQAAAGNSSANFAAKAEQSLEAAAERLQDPHLHRHRDILVAAEDTPPEPC